MSALQATIFSTIRRDEHAAAAYGDASLAGVERLAALASEEGIECDLERRAAYTYAAEASERSSVEQEMEAAAAAGPAASRAGRPRRGALRPRVEHQQRLGQVHTLESISAGSRSPSRARLRTGTSTLRGESAGRNRPSFARFSRTLRADRRVRWDAGALGVVPGLGELGYSDAYRTLHGYARARTELDLAPERGR